MNSSSYLQPMGIIYLHQGSGHGAATFMSENSVLFYSYIFFLFFIIFCFKQGRDEQF